MGGCFSKIGGLTKVYHSLVVIVGALIKARCLRFLDYSRGFLCLYGNWSRPLPWGLCEAAYRRYVPLGLRRSCFLLQMKKSQMKQTLIWCKALGNRWYVCRWCGQICSLWKWRVVQFFCYTDRLRHGNLLMLKYEPASSLLIVDSWWARLVSIFL